MKKTNDKRFFLRRSTFVDLRILISTALLITLTAMTGCGSFFDLPHQNPVDPLSPDYDSSPPEITITSHTDGQLVKDPSQVIEGAISDHLKSAFIIVNREAAKVEVKDGTFSQEIFLIEGENIIEVTATNISMRKSSQVITLILNSTMF